MRFHFPLSTKYANTCRCRSCKEGHPRKFGSLFSLSLKGFEGAFGRKSRKSKETKIEHNQTRQFQYHCSGIHGAEIFKCCDAVTHLACFSLDSKGITLRRAFSLWVIHPVMARSKTGPKLYRLKSFSTSSETTAKFCGVSGRVTYTVFVR